MPHEEDAPGQSRDQVPAGTLVSSTGICPSPQHTLLGSHAGSQKRGAKKRQPPNTATCQWKAAGGSVLASVRRCLVSKAPARGGIFCEGKAVTARAGEQRTRTPQHDSKLRLGARADTSAARQRKCVQGAAHSVRSASTTNAAFHTFARILFKSGGFNPRNPRRSKSSQAPHFSPRYDLLPPAK